MASFRDELAADYLDAIGDYEQTFLWNNKPYPCVRTTEPAALLVMVGGDEKMTQERITVPLAAFAGKTVPKQGDLIDKYALQVVKADPNVGHVVLWCSPPMNMEKM